MIFIAICTLILITLGLIENFCLAKKISKIKIRILVNGTRGKSTVVRLLNAALNNCGVKCIAKSTGSQASFILPDLTEKPINRKRGKNLVREQRWFFDSAAKNNCDAVVCECNAVRPENQKIYAEKVMKPTLVAITNTMPDHIDEMGEDTEKIIMLSVPESAEIVTTDEQYAGSLSDFNFKVHPASVALALKICKILDLDEEKALEGMKKANGDIGMTDNFIIHGKTVINGFAANDIKSSSEKFAGLNKDETTVVFANRKDREYRLAEFRKLFEQLGIKDIYVIGDNLKKCSEILNAVSYNGSEFEKLICDAKKTIFCCGNIVGSGTDFINFCMEHKE